MKTTKKELEIINDMLRAKLNKLEEELKDKSLQVKTLRELSVGGMTSSLVISAERISDAAAHIVSDVLKLKR